mgnify:CR=1 FL=1|tara:strand:- start:292 stop:813 length:522 start_codon:yes stop_codon:yes gene_type:complete
MKYYLFAITLFSIALTQDATAKRGGGFVIFGGGEDISLSKEMPDTEEWLSPEGEYLDVYVVHKQFSLFFIPIWSWDARYALSNENMDGYYDEDAYPEIIEEIETEHGDAWNGIPFREKWIQWIIYNIGYILMYIVIGFVGLFVLGYIFMDLLPKLLGKGGSDEVVTKTTNEDG